MRFTGTRPTSARNSRPQNQVNRVAILAMVAVISYDAALANIFTRRNKQ